MPELEAGAAGKWKARVEEEKGIFGERKKVSVTTQRGAPADDELRQRPPVPRPPVPRPLHNKV